MRLFSALFACVVALAFASPALAQSTPSGIRTGQQMLDQCTSSRAADLAACDAFLTGAQNAFIYLQDIGQTDKDICVPPGTAPAVLRQVAIDYWRANPGSRKFSAVSSFWNALVARFPAPCV